MPWPWSKTANPTCAFYRSFGQRHMAHVTISRLECSRRGALEMRPALRRKKRAESHPTRSSRHSTLKSRSSALSVSILLSLIRAEIWEP